jgi:hypothetical protein
MVNALLLPFLAILIIQLLLFLFSPPKGGKRRHGAGSVWPVRLRWVGGLALAAGLLAAASVYHRTARDPAEIEGTIIGYDVGAGYATPVTTRMTKKTEVQMEQIGGRANAVVAEFREWCGTLWHGRKLAYTLAIVSTAACAGCFFAARLLWG